MKELLTELAERYETAEFLPADPSQFMHQYSRPVEQERAAFIAAALSYGARKQFLPKIAELLESGIAPERADGECFYRLHTVGQVRRFLQVTDEIYADHGSLLSLIEKHGAHTALEALTVITSHFAARHASDLIPRNTRSTCKRLCMFLRWMVRDGSPVDLGLWSGQIDKRTLIIPMDTHVVQEARRLGLLQTKTTTMASAMKLTEKLREYFPDDPLKGDFALFGAGVAVDD